MNNVHNCIIYYVMNCKRIILHCIGNINKKHIGNEGCGGVNFSISKTYFSNIEILTR
jgi:hypothetical protein